MCQYQEWLGEMLVSLSLTFLDLSSKKKKKQQSCRYRKEPVLVCLFVSNINVTSDLLPSQIMSLQEQASRLEKDGGLDGLQIQHKLNTILVRKQQIKDLSQSRRDKLQTALLLALFYQNLAEVRGL